MRVKNFGHNVIYDPKHFYEPRTEREVLDILDRHRTGCIRVKSTGHSWSEIIKADDALVCMTHFIDIVVEERDSGPVARIGSGATLQYILDTLHRTSKYTLPTLGSIKRQTIAGATATATHGTGNTSLSNFIQEIKLACYDAAGRPRVKRITDGDDLLAARASLGCMGVVLEITIQIVPKFWMQEVATEHEDLSSILNEEQSWPQQQFFAFPHGWRWYAYHRKTVEEPKPQSKRAMRRHKLYDFFAVEIGLHALIKTAEWAANLFGRSIITAFWKYLVPYLVRQHKVTGNSDTILTLHAEHHYAFRHVEMELFIPKEQMPAAVGFVQEAISHFAGTSGSIRAETARRLSEAALLSDFEKLRSTYVHHYPLFFRRILAEKTLVAMNEGGERYSMSIFTFKPPRQRESYYDACNFLAQAFARMYSARPHWGKYNPLSYSELKPLYQYLDRFRDICEAHDPNGVFQNSYTRRVMGRYR